MPRIVVDGKEVQCRDGVPVLQAALEAGMEVPHYCYHPGLSIVASCRLCLMEMKSPHPQTKELVWNNKLLPSCQTFVKDGMEVRFASDLATQNQKHVMEYYLLNHPLDCPVCDKAGECYLQDYSEDFGNATSRMVEEKTKNPKKDIGPHTLLYQDRCVLCTRCVRFCDEVAGDAELSVVERGNRGEIDVFPGEPLDNPLQGNVVDLCPVGALLNKEFLFKQRVWMLRDHDSVCPGCSRGCTTHIDENDNTVHRIRPRYNEKVNQWWMCDEGRFGWSHVHDARRWSQPRARRGGDLEALRWEDVPGVVKMRLTQSGGDGGARLAVVLSPMLACEEAWLLAKFARTIAPRCTLVGGFVPRIGEDRKFPKGFMIHAEKCPNARGVERVIQSFGGAAQSFDEFTRSAAGGAYGAAYVTGGYPHEWFGKDASAAMAKIETLVVHDLFDSAASRVAAIVLPGASFAEREGCYVNRDGLVQCFERAVRPLDGVRADGQLFFELAGMSGLYRAARVRELMAATMPELASPHVPQKLPAHAH